ncbi:MAG: hypothetical protein ACQEWE_16410 [Bacillota bacterium]
MIHEISMKVTPIFQDSDLSISFHFEFKKSRNKIGEAFVSTYQSQQSPGEIRSFRNGSRVKENKIAIINRFEVVGELNEPCLKKLKHFLAVIGIAEIIDDSSLELAVN